MLVLLCRLGLLLVLLRRGLGVFLYMALLLRAFLLLFLPAVAGSSGSQQEK